MGWGAGGHGDGGVDSADANFFTDAILYALVARSIDSADASFFTEAILYIQR